MIDKNIDININNILQNKDNSKSNKDNLKSNDDNNLTLSLSSSSLSSSPPLPISSPPSSSPSLQPLSLKRNSPDNSTYNIKQKRQKIDNNYQTPINYYNNDINYNDINYNDINYNDINNKPINKLTINNYPQKIKIDKYMNRIINFDLNKKLNLFSKVKEFFCYHEKLQYYINLIIQKKYYIYKYEDMIDLFLKKLYSNKEDTDEYKFYWNLLYCFIENIKNLYKKYYIWADFSDDNLDVGMLLKQNCYNNLTHKLYNHKFIIDFLYNSKPFINNLWSKNKRKQFIFWFNNINNN